MRGHLIDPGRAGEGGRVGPAQQPVDERRPGRAGQDPDVLEAGHRARVEHQPPAEGGIEEPRRARAGGRVVDDGGNDSRPRCPGRLARQLGPARRRPRGDDWHARGRTTDVSSSWHADDARCRPQRPDRDHGGLGPRTSLDTMPCSASPWRPPYTERAGDAPGRRRRRAGTRRAGESRGQRATARDTGAKRTGRQRAARPGRKSQVRRAARRRARASRQVTAVCAGCISGRGVRTGGKGRRRRRARGEGGRGRWRCWKGVGGEIPAVRVGPVPDGRAGPGRPRPDPPRPSCQSQPSATSRGRAP